MANLQQQLDALRSADDQIGFLFQELIYIWDNKEFYTFMNGSADLTNIEIALCKQFISKDSQYYHTPDSLLEILRRVYINFK
jgi:hypothetical protein